jgi:hypothetical protein
VVSDFDFSFAASIADCVQGFSFAVPTHSARQLSQGPIFGAQDFWFFCLPLESSAPWVSIQLPPAGFYSLALQGFMSCASDVQSRAGSRASYLIHIGARSTCSILSSSYPLHQVLLEFSALALVFISLTS